MQGCDSTGDVGARYPRILGDHLTPGLLNPIPTKGTDYAHHITTWHPRLQNPNTSPDMPSVFSTWDKLLWTRKEKMVNLPSLRQNRMKLKTLSLANQVVGWTLKRQGNSLSGTSKVGGRCLVLPSAMRSSKSKHFCRTILACWKREDKIINSWYSNEKTSCDILLVYIRSIQETKMISSYRPNFLKVDYIFWNFFTWILKMYIFNIQVKKFQNSLWKFWQVLT